MLKNNIHVACQIPLGEERFPTPVGGFSGVVGTLVVIEPTPASENLPIMPTDAWLLHNSNEFDTSDNLFTSNYVQNQFMEAINIYCQVLVRVSYNIKKIDVFILKRIKFL